MRRFFPAAILSAVLAGCSGLGVKRDYDAGYDFGKLKAYAWQPTPRPQGGADTVNNSLMDDRIRAAVDRALIQKGFLKTGVDAADALVAYHYDVARETTGSDKVRTGIGVGMGSGGVFSGIGIGVGAGHTERETEILTISFMDPKSLKWLWQGSREKELTQASDPEKTTADINAIVKEILSKFPPKPAR